MTMGRVSDCGNGERTAHNRRQEEGFDQVADTFDRLLPSDMTERLEGIVSSAQIKAGDAVLDVGTGTGALIAPILKAMPSEVVACDLSRKMLAQAKAKYGRSVKYVQQDVIDLPGKEGPFDVVFCNAVFGNIYDQRQALKAIHSLLAEGGRLVISHPMGKDFVRRLKEVRPEYNIKELPDESEITPLLESQGLSLIEFVDEPELYLAIAKKA